MTPTAGFYAMPRIPLPPGRTDEDYVLALLRATGVLCVYGSGFGLPAADGYLRIVFLAPAGELSDVYRLMADFTRGLHSVTPRRGCPRGPHDCRSRIAVIAGLYFARQRVTHHLHQLAARHRARPAGALPRARGCARHPAASALAGDPSDLSDHRRGPDHHRVCW